MIIIYLLFIWAVSGTPQYKKRQVIDYDIAFSETSQVTLVITNCGQVAQLQQQIKSFFFYNTYPLKEVLLYDFCQTPEQQLKKSLPSPSSQSTMKHVVILTEKTNIVRAFQQLYSRVTTKYIINYAGKWNTYRGFGFVDSAVSVFNYAEKNSIKISQITSLYPLWGQYRYLGKMMITDTGIKFHQIRTFKPAERYYFTFNPSIINFNFLYNNILSQSIKDFASKNSCEYTDRDCIEKAIGRLMYERNKYFQVFINDGTIQSQVFQVQ